MDQETKILLGEAAATAFVAHLLIRRFGVACLVTMFLAPLLYGIESFFRLHLPPAKLSWLPMIFPFLALYSLGSALVVGFPFFALRRLRRRKTPIQS